MAIADLGPERSLRGGRLALGGETRPFERLVEDNDAPHLLVQEADGLPAGIDALRGAEAPARGPDDRPRRGRGSPGRRSRAASFATAWSFLNLDAVPPAGHRWHPRRQ